MGEKVGHELYPKKYPVPSSAHDQPVITKVTKNGEYALT